MSRIVEALQQKVIDPGICVGCGACVALGASKKSSMQDTENGPVPLFDSMTQLPDYMENVCPGMGVDYPNLYNAHYGCHPENWLAGHVEKVRTGFSGDPSIRKIGASGGVLTQTLIYLLETGRVAVVAASDVNHFDFQR